jgi:uncharacterized lipoprotein YehR (DUF1307 family)
MMKVGAALLPVAAILMVAACGAAEVSRRPEADKSGKQANQASQEKKLEEDIIKTDTGDLKITFIGHGTLMFGPSSTVGSL